MKKSLVLVFGVFFLFSCSIQSTKTNRPAVVWTQSNITEEEKKAAKVAVIEILKDPESARFGKFWALNGSNGIRQICGQVNAKNSYGGYTGMKVFFISNDKIHMEGSDFLGKLVPELCTPRTVN